MSQPVRIALVGDYQPDVIAHQAIPQALARAAADVGCSVEYDWHATPTLEQRAAETLAPYHGVWCVPASPYASMQGALNAIRYARESHTPFLGSCGGSQHALIEYARNVLGLHDADHSESNPDAALPLITPLACSLRETRGTITLRPGSRIQTIYGQTEIEEGFNCSYGLNRDFYGLLERGDLRIDGVDSEGELRVVELTTHPFFFATLFQPERSALAGITHPLIVAYMRAALATYQ